uniref:PlsC domain-containing protein n=1 Tax=Rhabditophanes sp. KR3021 TaxID=114890 RepID=A0AC35TVX4_9BILA
MHQSFFANTLFGFILPSWMESWTESVNGWLRSTFTSLDFDYLNHLFWLFLPIIIAFVLPAILIIFIYGCVIFLHIYGLRNRLREAYQSNIWDGARAGICSFWDAIGYIWHGYEVEGLQNIPDSGPALFVYYHGTLPIDIYYLIAKCVLFKKRTLHCVADKFIFKIPGWAKLCKVFCVTPGTIENCVQNLKEGNLLSIAPGGVREALFSNSSNYEIMWGDRLGFAKVAKQAKCPIIPVFTENCREAFRTPSFLRRLLRNLYEKIRFPLVPLYGGFPVKMITYLGPPIYFDFDNVTAIEIRDKVKSEIQLLIDEHQQLPGSIIRGMIQRFRTKVVVQKTTLFTNSNKETLYNVTRSQRLVEYKEFENEDDSSTPLLS